MSAPRPTPETDAFMRTVGVPWHEFARRLERERDEDRDRLRLLDWMPVTERLPTVEEASEYEDVEWSDGQTIWQNSYYLPNSNQHKATHWRRITLP